MSSVKSDNFTGYGPWLSIDDSVWTISVCNEDEENFPWIAVKIAEEGERKVVRKVRITAATTEEFRRWEYTRNVWVIVSDTLPPTTYTPLLRVRCWEHTEGPP